MVNAPRVYGAAKSQQRGRGGGGAESVEPESVQEPCEPGVRDAGANMTGSRREQT